MLDYQTLSTKFDEILDSFSVQDMKDWMAFDKQRLFDELSKGGTLLLHFDEFKVSRIYDDAKESISISDYSSTEFATAA